MILPWQVPLWLETALVLALGTCVVVGATTMAQLAEDIAAAQHVPDPETLADIAAIQERYPNPAG